MNMLTELPDVSSSDLVPIQSPLAWVGMESIDLPLPIGEPGACGEVHATVDAQVDLPSGDVKGIHMSRLYNLVDALADGDAITPRHLQSLLQKMVESHSDCGSGNARMRIAFELLVRRPALVTEGLSGWKSYPAVIEASFIAGVFRCHVQVCVVYSSTCPCSAALSRRLVQEGFLEAFGQKETVSPSDVAAWIDENASLATPHSQRSEARVTVHTDQSASGFGMLALIDQIEEAVGTPVQTAVKRADEQAFAALNRQNLMFVEDAARRIEAAMVGYRNPRTYVRHVESLHPHDAVAWADQRVRGHIE
ncbi:MAG: GTP cyclohydrolase FolE2 [Erythrobacter sp.]|uniref:GTP cyclohydrolase FolE2 n=1 Tax=Erythrobacter sp. TaxID=1042 RepID=UPI0026261FF3|nr:GTP cyclohydrolase FolE2 [Erythrobacter sp.]MDJ0977272.1 GTP cyclohydrolase FolE2 [Erythrobacter sp.]